MAEVSSRPQEEDAHSAAHLDERTARIDEKAAVSRRSPFVVRLLSSTWVLCVGVGIVALALNLYRLGAPSLWFDELLSINRARQPLPVIWQIVTTSQPNMALYYFFLHFWLQFIALLGIHPTEFAVRLPSAIFAAGASVLVFLLGRRFLGIAGGLAAAALYVLNDQQLIYAQEARSYGIQLLLICLGWYALFNVLSRDAHQRRWLACYIAAMTLSVYVHFFSLIVLFAQGVAIVGLLLLPGPWRQRVRQRFWTLALSLTITVILVVPMLIASRAGDKTGWIPIPKPGDVSHLFVTFANNSKIYLLAYGAVLVLGLVVAVLVYQTWGKRLLTRMTLVDTVEGEAVSSFQRLLPLGFVLLCWLIIPIIVSYIVSQKSVHLFLSRYLVTVVPPLFLLVGLGVAAVRWNVFKVILVCCLVVIAARYTPIYYASAQVEDWRTGSLWIEQHYQAGDGLVCYDNNQGCQVGVEYYFYAYPTIAHFDADSPGSWPWVDVDTTNAFGDSDAAVDSVALQRYASKHARIFFIVARLGDKDEDAAATAATQWLDTHYHLVATEKSSVMKIRVYDTTHQ